MSRHRHLDVGPRGTGLPAGLSLPHRRALRGTGGTLPGGDPRPRAGARGRRPQRRIRRHRGVQSFARVVRAARSARRPRRGGTGLRGRSPRKPALPGDGRDGASSRSVGLLGTVAGGGGGDVPRDRGRAPGTEGDAHGESDQEPSSPGDDVPVNLRGVALGPPVHVHERSEAGVVMQDENVRVTAALVDHPPVVPAFAYRFAAADRSIVFSGDTARSESVVRLAQGADVLVHSALYVPAVGRMVARVPNAARLKESIIAHQTSAEDAGRVAQAAGVKTLVLTHLVPPDDPEVTEQMWLDAARANFRSQGIVGPDLPEI